MPDSPAARNQDGIPTASLAAFTLGTFVLSWGPLGLYALSDSRIQALFGEVGATNPLFVLAVYAPAIMGLLLVWRHGGAEAMRRFLARLALWRAPAGWYAFLLIGIPAIYLLAAAAQGRGLTGNLTTGPPSRLLAIMAFMLVLGPLEEFGWRGYALPLLQRQMAPLWAGLLLGVVWGLWHLPAFHLEGTPQSEWPFRPFLVATIAESVILTALFNASGGSLLLPVLFHFQINNPVWPDAQPLDSVLFAVVAVAVAWLHRDRMLGRSDAMTAVVPTRGAAPRRIAQPLP